MVTLENNYVHLYLIKRKLKEYKHKWVCNVSRIDEKQECLIYLFNIDGNRGHA
jgi:hypothetical protein